MAELYKKPIFDCVHGFIHLTKTEDKIVNSLYFQRLRWIKQLGWSHYIFPGATHTRFAHALGVLFVMDKIVRSLDRGVDDDKLFNLHVRDQSTMFHRKMRLAAMLHDVGTFPFSHSVEQGYLQHYKKTVGANGRKTTAAGHEELGSFIINNTDFDGGITQILKADGFDPEEISQIIKGQHANPLANQLMHSDIDADRIDYLLRDSHHTGVKYGVFDMEYLVANMRVVNDGKNDWLAFNESALTVVEYFLISRYSWYTQIIHEGTGYKFDLLAARIAEFFIESGHIHSFEELKIMATRKPREFFGFHDGYFMDRLQEALLPQGEKSKHPMSQMLSEMAEMLLFRVPPKQIKLEPFEPTLINTPQQRIDHIDRIWEAVEWLRAKLKNVPTGWVVEEVPAKDVIFTKGVEALKKSGKIGTPVAQESVKIVDRNNRVRLLVDMPNSLVRILSQYQNFIPRVYVSRSTHRFLQSKGCLDELESRFGIQAQHTDPTKKVA